MDPDFITNPLYKTVIAYTDENQFLKDVPWTVKFLGSSSSDSLLEEGEKAEVTVWLLARNNDVADVTAANATAMWEPDARGSSGILSTSGTLLTVNDRFTLEVKPTTGGVLTVQRNVPPKFDPVMDLK
jgi:archaellin